MEIWKVIPNYPKYEASDLGSVRHSHRPTKRLRPSVVNGHLAVTLYDVKGKAFSVRVHAAVLFAFVGPRPKGKHGAHLDGDAFNNRLSNLVWATPAENEAHKRLHRRSLIGERHHQAILTEAQVKQVLALRDLPKRLKGYAALAREFGVSYSTVYAIVEGRNWRHLAATA